MDYEPTFRLITIIVFAAVLVTGVYHRARASGSGETISRREEGPAVMILLRLFGFGTWIALLIYMLNPQWMLWSMVSLPLWSRCVGAAFSVAVVPLIAWMFSSLGKNVTDTVAIRKEHSLVTHGPYRWVRHPMYSITFLAVLGFALLTANWLIGLTGTLALLLLGVRTPIEERKLIEEFGPEYQEYMRQTGRFFPRWRTVCHGPRQKQGRL